MMITTKSAFFFDFCLTFDSEVDWHMYIVEAMCALDPAFQNVAIKVLTNVFAVYILPSFLPSILRTRSESETCSMDEISRDSGALGSRYRFCCPDGFTKIDVQLW
jgi:hypothetical protein